MNTYSHDLMNSLYTIKGMAEVHLETIPEDSHLDSDVLVRVKRKAEEALSIVRRLQAPPERQNRDSDRFSRGKRPLSLFCQKVSIHRAFEETRRLLTKQGLTEGIEFLNRIPNDFPLIHCKRSQFREILYHLMKNACEAMKDKEEKGVANDQLDRHCEPASPQERRIRPLAEKRAWQSPGPEIASSGPSVGRPRDDKTRRIIFRAAVADAEKAVLRLTDTGEGIPPEHLSRLFQPFFTTKLEGRGNGLGLYLAKQLSQENSGSISFESFPGEGTTVILTFPLASAAG